MLAPDQFPEDLQTVMTVRSGGGRELSLEEFPIGDALRVGESVRQEEIVLRLPDGRSITSLMNVMSVRLEEGVVESVVVTLKYMTLLEELERLPAWFPGMVSHDLPGPLTSIRGSTATLFGAEDSLN